MSLACPYYSDDIITVSSDGVMERHLRDDSGVVGSSFIQVKFLTYSGP